ncbi:hypothetical protein ABZV46_45200, partial [Streptomyces sp. NPDC005209]
MAAAKAKLLARLGCDVVINREEIGIGGELAVGADTVELAKRLGRAVRSQLGEDPHVAFDQVGRATFGSGGAGQRERCGARPRERPQDQFRRTGV